jgi:hypothetical protein
MNTNSQILVFWHYKLGIVNSQIDTGRIFNVVGIIKGLRHGHLGIENLEKLVLIMKN